MLHLSIGARLVRLLSVRACVLLRGVRSGLRRCVLSHLPRAVSESDSALFLTEPFAEFFECDAGTVPDTDSREVAFERRDHSAYRDDERSRV